MPNPSSPTRTQANASNDAGAKDVPTTRIARHGGLLIVVAVLYAGWLLYLGTIAWISAHPS